MKSHRTLGALLLAGCIVIILAGCGSKESASAPTKATNTPPDTASGNPITAPVDYIGAVGQAQKHSTKTIDLVQVKKAIQTFQAAEDRFPKDLNELVATKYLGVLPVLPTGMKYSYDAQSGDVKVVKTQ